MNICWRLGTATARQVYEESLEAQQRGYQTIKTLLDRMEGKGFLTREKLGPLVLFTPAVEKRPALSSAVGDFVDTVLGKSLAPLCLHLAEQEGLEDAERDALQNLIDRLSEREANEQAAVEKRGTVQISVREKTEENGLEKGLEGVGGRSRSTPRRTRPKRSKKRSATQRAKPKTTGGAS